MSRPIAMSARIYFPVSQNRRNSVWSLYRIDPDGRNRVRLTDGLHDDTEPRWSPDGRRIAFVRTPVAPRDRRLEGPDTRGGDLCVIDADGGPVRRIASLEGVSWPEPRWEDGGREPGFRSALAPSPKTAALPGGGTAGVDNATGVLVVRDAAGRVLRRLPLPKVEDMADGWDPPQPCPNAPRKVLLGRLGGESTFGHFTVYRSVDTRTGAVADAGAGRFLALAPDQMRYATVVRRQGAHYTKGSVWVQPLEIGRLGGGDTTPVTPGLIYVVGADWRGGARR